jgi:predicted Zn-dependent protease with MMP-like domain
MSIFSLPFLSSRGRKESDAASQRDRDCTLRLFLSDTVCELIVEDRAGGPVTHITHQDTAPPSNPAALLSAAICRLPPEIEDRIGNVAVFVDDPEISVVDSRQAKLTHFEGRALSEFGKYQLGGKPISFASHAYGQRSAQEAEKRIVGYISEDRLSMVLFALGKLAKYTTFYGPWSLQTVLHDEQGEPEAKLALHGHFSTLTIANCGAGAVAVRHLPIGTSTLVSAYAEQHGLPFVEAATALQSRARLGLSRDQPLEAHSPAAHVGSYLALAPILSRLKEVISETTDYFEFQRLAGRAPALSVHVTGDALAGLGNWLGALLEMDVHVGDGRDTSATANTSALNFLEGMRSGLLKLGSQLYDFSAGHFVPSRLGGARPSNGAAADHTPSPLMQKLKGMSAQTVTVKDLQAFAPALCAVALMVLAGYAANAYWLAPINDQLAANTSAYDSVVTQPATNPALQPAANARAEPVLWARDIMTIASAMAYDMKLTHIEMSASRPGSDSTLELTGTLPKDGTDNLQLIGKFMSRLAAAPASSRRFGDFTFSGAADAAGAAAGADQAGAPGQMQFRLDAKLTGAAR